MCLAEALLRTPDEETRDRLIAEKIASADWASHARPVGQPVRQRLDLGPDADRQADRRRTRRRSATCRASSSAWPARLGEPVIRRRRRRGRAHHGRAVRARPHHREGAQRAPTPTASSARSTCWAKARAPTPTPTATRRPMPTRSRRSARHAKGAGPGARPRRLGQALGAVAALRGARRPSACLGELYPRILRLALMAAEADINFTLDAEEADRLVLSLELLDRLAREPELGAWRGLGLAVQAYQKRGPQVIEAVAGIAARQRPAADGAAGEGRLLGQRDQARPGGRPARLSGLHHQGRRPTSPTWSAPRRCSTPRPHLYAPVRHPQRPHPGRRAPDGRARRALTIEFQRLHGMGEALYAAADERYGDFPLRVYAPVGSHEDLLPYLVRRLLENGANTSFVHALLDEKTPVAKVVVDPIARGRGGRRRAATRASRCRATSTARRAATPRGLRPLHRRRARRPGRRGRRAGRASAGGRPDRRRPARRPAPASRARPADRDRVDRPGRSRDARRRRRRLRRARKAPSRAWDARGGAGPRRGAARHGRRAGGRPRPPDRHLRRARPARPCADAIAEVREAADFCRYYADLAERQFAAPETLRGPVGETNQLEPARPRRLRLHQPLELPAGHLHRPDRRRAGRRQRRARQARRTDPADRRRGGAAVPRGRRSRPTCSHLLPGDGATVGAALIAPSRLRRRRLHRRHRHRLGDQPHARRAPGPDRALHRRDRRPERHVRRHHGAARAGDRRRASSRPSARPASAARRCACCSCRTTPPTMLIEGLKGAMDALVVGDPADPAHRHRPGDRRRGARPRWRRTSSGWSARPRCCSRLPAPGRRPLLRPGPGRDPDAGLPAEREVFGPILHVVRYDPAKLDEAAAPLVQRAAMA